MTSSDDDGAQLTILCTPHPTTEGQNMRNTKNQTRMEALSNAAAIVKAVMVEMRTKDLTRAEVVGLDAELRTLELQVSMFRDTLGLYTACLVTV